MNEAPSAGGFPPAFFSPKGAMMSSISIFVDESGERGQESEYYLLTLVFHDQNEDILERIRMYEQALRDRRLPDIPFHAGPLFNGHDDYESIPLPIRKQLFTAFYTLVWHLPITYTTFTYRKHDLRGIKELETHMKQDIINFLFTHLEWFQQYDAVKIYYDGGQPVATYALRTAVEYALSMTAIQYRNSSPRDYRLSQVADCICALELTAQKYVDKRSTVTDGKMFGGIGAFKRNYLKKIRRMRLDR